MLWSCCVPFAAGTNVGAAAAAAAPADVAKVVAGVVLGVEVAVSYTHLTLPTIYSV